MMKIINPATEATIAEVEENNKDDVKKIFEDLKFGQKEWSVLETSARVAILVKFGNLVTENKEELSKILCSETGKPITQARNEVGGALNRINHIKAEAEKWLKDEDIITEGETTESIRYEPLGVIGNISAWNFPYNVGFNVFLYALVSGNAVMYKPSEYATLTGLKFQELLFQAGVPENVFATVVGDGKVGEYLLDLPLNGYFFTGSYRTGVAIAEKISKKLVPLQLELGGKDPLYVMDDVFNVKTAAINAAEGAFYNNGQSCCAVERIYVHEKIYAEFLDHFIEEIQSKTLGDPTLEDTFFGPLTRKEQIKTILDQVKDAKLKGAKILLGGDQPDQKGYYIKPTILTHVDHTMEIMKEESFGPVIGIQKVKSDAEAINLMNDTEYGLTAAVFSSNEQRARNVLDVMNTGTVYWNCCDRVSPNLPWSGRKHSGLGSTLSYTGIRAFTQPKAYQMRKPN